VSARSSTRTWIPSWVPRGVRALLARCARLTRDEFPFLEVSIVAGSTELRECLRARDPIVAVEAAAALFGTFFRLVDTFIGERLTSQVLRRAWPTIASTAAGGEEK
jgi:hypothetical protein